MHACNIMNLNASPTVRNLPTKSALIVNPIFAGAGDHSTGLKVKTCFETMGYLTQLFPIELSTCTENDEGLCSRAIAQTEQLILDDHSRSVIKAKPLVVITPLNKLYCAPVEFVFATIKKHIRLVKNRLLIINEMGYQPSRGEIALFQNFLKSLKFRHVVECTLGFDKSQTHIGYMKLPDSELADIEQNHQSGIKKFCDSLNIDINIKNDLIFFSYLSSGKKLTCSLNFIKNSWLEAQALDENHHQKSSHYVFILRHCLPVMADWLADDLIKWEYSPYHITGAKVRIFTLVNNQLEPHGLNENSTDGPSINIYLVYQSIPTSVFRYFIRLSILGSMTGDNSFCEYLSIKGSLPYYEIQPWKSEFVKEWWKQADTTGIDHLKTYYQARCFGNYQPMDEQVSSSHYLSMTEIDKDSPGGKEIMTERETVALVKEITRRKHEFEDTMLSQDARLTIQALCRPAERSFYPSLR